MGNICLKLFEFMQVVPENHLAEEERAGPDVMLNSAEHEIYPAHKC